MRMLAWRYTALEALAGASALRLAIAYQKNLTKSKFPPNVQLRITYAYGLYDVACLNH